MDIRKSSGGNNWPEQEKREVQNWNDEEIHFAKQPIKST